MHILKQRFPYIYICKNCTIYSHVLAQEKGCLDEEVEEPNK
jgi:hypothetical protein